MKSKVLSPGSRCPMSSHPLASQQSPVPPMIASVLFRSSKKGPLTAKVKYRAKNVHWQSQVLSGTVLKQCPELYATSLILEESKSELFHTNTSPSEEILLPVGETTVSVSACSTNHKTALLGTNLVGFHG